MSGGGEDLRVIRGKEEVVRVPMMAEEEEGDALFGVKTKMVPPELKLSFTSHQTTSLPLPSLYPR